MLDKFYCAQQEYTGRHYSPPPPAPWGVTWHSLLPVQTLRERAALHNRTHSKEIVHVWEMTISITRHEQGIPTNYSHHTELSRCSRTDPCSPPEKSWHSTMCCSRIMSWVCVEIEDFRVQKISGNCYFHNIRIRNCYKPILVWQKINFIIVKVVECWYVLWCI